MDLVFPHGPAAAGKLTVARALEARVGLPVFHNHLVVDALLPAFRKLTSLETLRRIRAARHDVEQPPADLDIDTDHSAATIAAHFALTPRPAAQPVPTP